MSTRISKPIGYLTVTLAILTVGWLDYVSGSEIRILSLYFLPLVLAGWTLGRSGALITAVFTTATWLLVMYTTGVRFSDVYIWPINAVTEGVGFLTVALLVALLREAIENERKFSRRDSLTGLANRREFMELASLAVAVSKRHHRPFSLVYIDLDNFKNANDAFGHERGDDLLCRCATLIADCVRVTDSVARLGGDEFAVLLPETDSLRASSLIERIRVAIDTDPAFQTATVTASIGVISEFEVESDIRSLLRKADESMYQVKRRLKRHAVAYPCAHQNEPIDCHENRQSVLST